MPNLRTPERTCKSAKKPSNRLCQTHRGSGIRTQIHMSFCSSPPYHRNFQLKASVSMKISLVALFPLPWDSRRKREREGGGSSSSRNYYCYFSSGIARAIPLAGGSEPTCGLLLAKVARERARVRTYPRQPRDCTMELRKQNHNNKNKKLRCLTILKPPQIPQFPRCHPQ